MKELLKKLIRRLLGWYIDPICQENERQQAQIERQQEQLEQQQAQIEQQKVRIEQQQAQIEEQEAQSEQQKNQIEQQRTQVESFQAQIKQYAAQLEQQQIQIKQQEARSEYLQEQVEQYAAQMEQILNQQKDQLLERFEGHDRRLTDIEQREEWTRKRFEGHDQRLSDIERREEWTRERFEGHDRRLSDIEGREEWTRERFEGHDEKIYELIRWTSELETRAGKDLIHRTLGDTALFPPSRLCTAKELLSPECQQYRDALRIDDVHALLGYPHFSRKEWEFETICRTLDTFGMLAQGKTGIGFAVGQEPLSAYFALRGCTVLASDLAPDMDEKGLWSDTNQNAMGDLSQINRFGICPPELFEARVSYRDIDMNDIPEDVGEFDFCWSSCAIEHIGSLGHSIRFLKNMLKVLKPGGVAVHTTEINLSSRISTIERGDSAIFKDSDIQEVYEWMTEHGHKMTVDFTRGSEEMDLRRSITGKKYTDYMLNCNIEGYDSTSFIFIIEKKRGADRIE